MTTDLLVEELLALLNDPEVKVEDIGRTHGKFVRNVNKEYIEGVVMVTLSVALNDDTRDVRFINIAHDLNFGSRHAFEVVPETVVRTRYVAKV